MATRRVLQLGDPALRRTSRQVEDFGRKLHQLLDDMYSTMKKEDGCGLAAPQVGVLRRAVVIDMGGVDENATDGTGRNAYGEKGTLIELINPEIISAKDDKEGSEGCLSVRGKRGYVVRPQVVTYKAQDRFGVSYTKTVTGRTAVAVSHEIDHLNGILYIDKMTRYVTEQDEQDEKEERDKQNARRALE